MKKDHYLLKGGGLKNVNYIFQSLKREFWVIYKNLAKA